MTYSIRLYEGYLQFYCESSDCKYHKDGMCNIRYGFFPKFQCALGFLGFSNKKKKKKLGSLVRAAGST